MQFPTRAVQFDGLDNGQDVGDAFTDFAARSLVSPLSLIGPARSGATTTLLSCLGR